jgi:hypothetical protein
VREYAVEVGRWRVLDQRRLGREDRGDLAVAWRDKAGVRLDVELALGRVLEQRNVSRAVFLVRF